MNRIYMALTKQEADHWIGWIEEVPGVNCQEETHEQLIETLRVTLQEAIEFNRHDAIREMGTGFHEEQLVI